MGEGEGVPLSAAQQRMWWMAQYNPEDPTSAIAKLFRLEGRLDVRALEHSLTRLVARHEILRATFHARDGIPVQVVGEPTEVRAKTVDLRPLPEPAQKTQAQELISKEIHHAFDLSRDQLLRAALFRLRDDEHLLLLMVHGIAGDSWSLEVLFRELGAAYAAYAAGREPELPEPARSCADAASEERRSLASGALDDQLSYWSRQLAGIPSALALPSDCPRPARRTHAGAEESMMLPEALSAAIHALARSNQGTTVFTILLAAFQTLLYRYTATEDIVVGTPVPGRLRARTPGIVGPCANFLALRTNFSGQPSFRQLLGRVREIVQGAQDHQNVPFEKLLEALHPERSFSHAPVFQVAFRVAPGAILSATGAGLKLEEVPFESGVAPLDLTLEVIENGAGLECRLNYDRDLFFGSTIRRMLGHYRTLLEAATEDPDSPVDLLPMLTEAERHQLLGEWSNGGSRGPDARVLQLFEMRAKRSPEATAAIFGSERMSYGELNRKAERLARALRQRGIGPDQLAGICLERSPNLIVGLLGVLKSGAAFLPLDPLHPRERLAFLLKDAGVRALLTERESLHTVAGCETEIVPLEEIGEETGARGEEAEASRKTGVDSANSLAYVAYTSGSTGMPKGAMISHQGLANYVRFLTDEYGLGPRDVVLQLASFSFDVSFREILAPLAVGAQVVMVSSLEAREPTFLLQKIREHKVTCLLGALPTTLNALAEAASASRFRCDSLRLILVSGEMLQRSDCRRAITIFGSQVALVNQYGPTECTMTTTYYRVQDPRRCVHRLFEAQAERTPDAIAVRCEAEELSYRELNQRATHVAQRLRALGVRPDVPVGVFAERTPEMLVGVLGILKAGGAYVPFELSYPRERLSFMAQDSGVRLVLSQRRLADAWPSSSADLVFLDELGSGGGSEEEPAGMEGEAQLDNLAYVIYTSGSTGTPKGVMVGHRGLVNYLEMIRREVGFTEQDVLPAISPLSFDICALDLFLPLVTGGCVVIVRRETAMDPRKLGKTLADCGATVLHATPAAFEMLRESGWKARRGLRILSAGETLPRALANQLLEQGAALWNLYGPTEATIDAAFGSVQPGEGPVPVGRPIPNAEIYILDRHLQPTPIGVFGEVHIGGIGLARGYLNRRELTAERFIPHPFRSEPEARLYKTGDIGRFRADGQIELAGRLDHQVKVRGFRIELGEIEAALSQHPAVQAAAVLAREDAGSSKQLVAYVAGDRRLEGRELRNFLKEKLPEYMVPSRFVFLERLPLTPNGKLDRRALPAPSQLPGQDRSAFVPPATPVEKELAEIWGEVLGVGGVGAEDNFFELGGHSLLVARVVSRVRRVFNVELPVRVFFEFPTVAELAAEIEQRAARLEARA
jgi:amino acid adenylation domain-containing protein